MKYLIENHFALLGMKVKDKVTGFEGVVASISFDLYGCIVCAVTPEVSDDGKLRDGRYFDLNRLTLVGDEPVMDVPNYLITEDSVAEAEAKGLEEVQKAAGKHGAMERAPTF